MEPTDKQSPAPQRRPLFGRRDWIWAFLLLAAAGAFLLYTNWERDSAELSAVLWVEGEPRLSIPLSDPPESVSLEPYGIQGRLEAEPGRIRFSQMDCPDKICEKAGWLSRENQTAVCMPNRVSLTLLPAGQTPDLP